MFSSEGFISLKIFFTYFSDPCGGREQPGTPDLRSLLVRHHNLEDHPTERQHNHPKHFSGQSF